MQGASGALTGSLDPFGFAKESAGPQTCEPAQVAGRIGWVRLRVFVRAVLAGMRRAGRSAGICRCAAVARSRGRFRRGAPSALIGVVEAASCELDAARGEDLLGLRTALRAAHLGALGHRVLNFKDFTAYGATVIIACHTSPNERIAFKQTTVLYPNRSSSNRWGDGCSAHDAKRPVSRMRAAVGSIARATSSSHACQLQLPLATPGTFMRASSPRPRTSCSGIMTTRASLSSASLTSRAPSSRAALSSSGATSELAQWPTSVVVSCVEV